MRPTRVLPFVSLLLLISTSALAVDCQTFLDGSTYCTGPQGYQAAGQSYTGGYSEYRDNRGNTAQVQHDPYGGVSAYAPTGVVPQVVPSKPYENHVYPQNIHPRVYPK